MNYILSSSFLMSVSRILHLQSDSRRFNNFRWRRCNLIQYRYQYVFHFFFFSFLSWYPQWSASGVSKPSIFVCLKNSRRSTQGGGGVMVVLPLKCYLNDKVVWLRGLRGVILYTFTRLHRETGTPTFGLHRPRVAAPCRAWKRAPRAPYSRSCMHACCT